MATRWITCLPLLSLLAGCDAGAGPDYLPPLVVIRGEIASSVVQLPPDVYVAAGWAHLKATPPDAGDFNPFLPVKVVAVTQDAVVRLGFPARFEVGITKLPPEDSFFLRGLLPPGTMPAPPIDFATGALVIWQDGDGNGRLDPTPPGGPPSKDLWLSTTPRVGFAYVESYADLGGLGGVDMGALHPGFMVELSWPVDLPPDGYPCNLPIPERQEIVPASTPVQLAIDEPPQPQP